MCVHNGRELTAARTLAETMVAELAEVPGVTPSTLHRLEIGGAVPICESSSRRQCASVELVCCIPKPLAAACAGRRCPNTARRRWWRRLPLKGLSARWTQQLEEPCGLNASDRKCSTVIRSE